MELRDYQTKTIQSLFDYLYSHEQGNPCVVAPTGSGKSILIAKFCEICNETWPDKRILVLTHQKELIRQDALKFRELYERADIGLYAANLGLKELGHKVTFASIQSIYKLEDPIRHFDIAIVDECHLINNENKGIYRRFLEKLHKKVVGFTATPYRLGQGMVVEKGSIFTDLIETISIRDLQNKGYLSRLTTKGTAFLYDLTKLKVSGGDYTEASMQAELDTYESNETIAKEIVHSARIYHKKHWLIFCTGIEHAEHMAEEFRKLGIKAECISSNDSQDDREDKLYRFTHGYLTALTNATLLTTGFDYPEIDLIAMLRPTLSPGLYSQILGRGLRIAPDKNYCLVLDFAGNILRHGPVTDVQPPSKRGGKQGLAPMHECPQCLEIMPIQYSVCPICGYVFPKKEKQWLLYTGEINGGEEVCKPVSGWYWITAISKKTGLPMVRVDFRILGSHDVSKYFCLWHPKFAGTNAKKQLRELCQRRNIDIRGCDWDSIIDRISLSDPPVAIITVREGKNENVVEMLWEEDIKLMELDSKRQERMRDETRADLLLR